MLRTSICVILAFISALSARAQTGLNCSSAIPVTGILNNQIQTATETWYEFMTDSIGIDTMHIGVLTTESSNGFIDQIDIYRGTCASLTPVSSAFRNSGDSVIVDTFLTDPNEHYFIKLSTQCNSCTGPISFDLNVASVAGALGYFLDPNGVNFFGACGAFFAPCSITICQGGTIQFFIATPGQPNLTKWELNNVNQTGCGFNQWTHTFNAVGSYTVTCNQWVCNPLNPYDGTFYVNVINGVNIAIAPNSAICVGQSVTLTASNVTNPFPLTWSTGHTNINPISVSPVVTTTYTASVVTCPSSSATVTVFPAVSASAGPDIDLCSGNSITLIGNVPGAGNSGSWSEIGGPILCSNCATINVTPNQTTSYQYTVSNSACSASDNATVTINPTPNSIISGPPVNNCGNGLITYLAPCNSGIQYTWSISSGSTGTPLNSNCQYDVNWSTLGGTLTLVATDPGSNCSSTQQLSVVECCDPNAIYIHITNTTASDVIANSPYWNGNAFDAGASTVVIDGIFTIDANFAFQNCSAIDPGPNAQIQIRSGQSLTINNTTIKPVKCDYMWDGIYIQDVSASLNIINNSSLEQAKNAVVSQNGGHFFIENSQFKNDYKCIVVEPYLGNHTGVVRNVDFTMQGNFILANPALPVGHTKTVCAIEIFSNANITVGDPTSLAYQNDFTNVLVGVRTSDTKATIVNARFTNIVPSFLQAITVPNAGSGIVAIGKKGLYFQPSITVGGTGLNQCLFSDVNIAIDALQRLNVNITNNSISRVHQYGIRIRDIVQSTITVSNNLITNQGSPFGFNTGILLLECYNCNVLININVIRQTNVVALQNGIGIRVGLVTPGDILLNVVGNMIERVRTGILAEQLVGKDHVFIASNTISFQKANVQYSSPHAGIYLMRCATVSARYNVISKTGSNPVAGIQQRLTGIYIDNSSLTLAAHNTLTKMGSGIFGWQDCANSTLACNFLDRCFSGFLFDGTPTVSDPNGGCNIGDQVLDPNFNPAPTGNTWVTLGSPGATDIAGDIFPGISWYRDAYIPSLSLSGGSLTGNTTTFSNNPSACTIVQYMFAPIQEREHNVGQTVLNPIPFSGGNELSYSSRRDAHRKLRETPTWMSLGTPQDSTFAAFYSINENCNIGLLRDFEEMLAVDSFSAAQNTLNNLVVNNNSEANINVVYSIYCRSWGQGTYEFTSTDSVQLYNIATQHASDGGEAVYAARVMLDLLIYESAANSSRQINHSLEVDSVSEITIYPNPAGNQVSINLELEEQEVALLIIVDLQGKEIKSISTNQTGPTILDLTEIDNGLYLVQVLVNGELVETKKLEVMHD